MRTTQRQTLLFAFPRVFTVGALALAMVLGMVATRPAPAAAQSIFGIGDPVYVGTDALNYRTGPGLGYAVIDVFYYGKEGAITGGPIYADGWTWYEFSTAGYGPDGATPGWVAGEFLARRIGGDGYPVGTVLAVDTAWLNLRSVPWLGADVLAVLPLGMQVTVSDGPIFADGYTWYWVQTPTAAGLGWVAGEFLIVAPGGSVYVPGESVMVNTDFLNYRGGPGVGYPVWDILPYGFDLLVVSGPVFADGWTWYEVSAPGSPYSGWVAGEYLAYA